jgi:hypothetical protein
VGRVTVPGNGGWSSIPPQQRKSIAITAVAYADPSGAVPPASIGEAVPEAGDYPFLDHAIARAYKGAIGVFYAVP